MALNAAAICTFNLLLGKDGSPRTVLPYITGIRMKERETTVHIPTLKNLTVSYYDE